MHILPARNPNKLLVTYAGPEEQSVFEGAAPRFSVAKVRSLRNTYPDFPFIGALYKYGNQAYPITEPVTPSALGHIAHELTEITTAPNTEVATTAVDLLETIGEFYRGAAEHARAMNETRLP